ncbi:WD40-repeat-containing domain protein [Suillus spraguei]|nr:WD40-repeat-containing domain protein [Suillus spraguei]
MSELIPITTPLREFKGHESYVKAVSVFPDQRRMVTASADKTLRLWDLKTGDVLKKMEGHSDWVRGLAVSRDGQLIASGDDKGVIIIWHGETGESLTQPIKVHSHYITSLNFPSDGTVLASGSFDKTTKLWNTKTWQEQADPIGCVTRVHCVRYSPSGELLAIATDCNIQIYNSGTREPVASFKGHSPASLNFSLTWTPDGTRLLTGGYKSDPTIREWDTSTWQQVGDPWQGHSKYINAITFNPAGTLVASASEDNHVRLWQFSDRRTIATFEHSSEAMCVTFSVGGKRILSGGEDRMISEWAVPNDINSKIPAITTAPIAYIDGDSSTTEPLTQNINSDTNKIMLSKLDNAPEAQIRDLREQYVYVHPSQAEHAIQKAIWNELEYAPLRLLNTSTGLLCDRTAQISTFKTSTEYKELLSSITKHSDLQTEHITDVVATYFRCVLLSHRWEETEALLHDIQDKVVYKLNKHGGIAKLQSFCNVARDVGYRWAWMDTCCIDKKSNTELQESVNSMFVWYRHSALTIVYLSDVLPSSDPGALARSVWNERGWTFQEFVAPKVVLFYQKDWSLYLGDRSFNHKESPAIMKELEDATGIDARALVTFRPGMSGPREKLQWASKRVTTVQEDVAYSLFGIFGITLPVIYGEKKQNALGRLLQEIVARSGDISVLDWIGQPSEFNSCLPAHITSYTTPPRTLPSLSDDDIHTEVSSLQQTVPGAVALKFYETLEDLRAPRFANCRLHLPCISFRVTEIRRRRGITYRIKADGLRDLLVTTAETLVQFSRAKPIQQTFLLIRPWDRYLLGVPDFADQPDLPDDTESIGDSSELESPIDDSETDDSDASPGGSPVEEEPGSRGLQLMVRLAQPFDAFLLAQQRVGEYKRIASDHNIVAQVKDISSVGNVDIGTVEIL